MPGLRLDARADTRRRSRFRFRISEHALDDARRVCFEGIQASGTDASFP